MLIEAVVAAALHSDSLVAERSGASAEAPASCALPALDPSHKLVVIRLSGGESVSTVAVAGLDRATETGEIRIGAGAAKLNVVIEANDTMVVRFSGHVSRLSKVVVMSPAGAGVTGIPSKKVRFSIGRKCRLPHDAQQLRTGLGKRPDIFWEVGDLYRGWTDGKTYRHEEVARSTDSPPTYFEAQLNWLHPGGVVTIDPGTVVSSGEAVTYSVLPYAAGAVQLEREGALVPVTPAEVEEWKKLARVRQGERAIETFTMSGTPYRVTRPIRVPAGLCGGHGLTFFVPSREYLFGDWCHSNVLALDGRILAPSWYANDPHCGSTQFTAFAQPHAPGPLRLRDIFCAVTKTSQMRYGYVPSSSPDAKYMAFLPNSHDRSPLRVQEINEEVAPPRDYAVTSAQFRSMAFWQSEPPYKWRHDSQAIWATRTQSGEKSTRPPLEPVIVSLDGSIKPLPELKHPAGPVEAMMWVGGGGQAIAQLRGDPFDPMTRKVRPASFAMVNGETGTILDSFEPAAYAQLRGLEPALNEFFYPNRIVAAQRNEGQLHALMDFGPWVSWRQGEKPRIIRELPQASDAVMSADAKTVLLLRPNLPGEDNRAWIIHCDGDEEEGGRHGPCPKRQAREGTWASLHDVETGKQLWGLLWTFDRYDRLGAVSLSPDSKLALIPLLSRTDLTKTLIAVVSMSNGKVVQTLPTPPSDYSIGFAEDGKAAWIVSMRATTIYSVQ